MTKGPRRLKLDHYLDSATEGFVKNAGQSWKDKADDLQILGDALKQAAAQAELRIGEQTLTGPALRAGMEESSSSILDKSERLRLAGEALRQVGQQIADSREARDTMKDLGAKPSPYQAPAALPGVELTEKDIQNQVDASNAREAERSAWQDAYDKQEAHALALTQEMDAAFLAAIPPMAGIHGQQDPTEPPPNVPSGPDGPYLPGTQAPPPTGGGAGGGGGGGGGAAQGHLVLDGQLGAEQDPTKNTNTNNTTTTTHPPKPPTVVEPPVRPPLTEPTTTHVHTETPSTTVSGTSQSGVTYQGPSAGTSLTSSSSGSPGGSAAALGAAGAAGGASGMAGSIRPGAPVAGAGSVRAIGSTARAGGPGALSRPAGASGSTSATARGAGTGSTRGAAGSSTGRGAAGARGAATGSGSRSGGRGSSGARSGAAGGRGGRKGERDQVTDRDRLVYDQDWLGDDDVAPGVLD